MISKKVIDKIIKELNKRFPNKKESIKIGVNQVAKLWQKEDGTEEDFFNFCIENFMDDDDKEKVFQRYNTKYEYIKGYLTALYLRLRIELDEDTGELLNIDRYFSTLNPANHLIEDLFKTKIAFVILLNWELEDFKTIIKKMETMTRKEWAKNRMVKQFESRIPADITQKITNAYSKASEYIYSYNIPIKNITWEDGTQIFNEDLKLISHWGLRDQIKLYYSQYDELSLKKQKTIFKLMERIIKGELPRTIIKNQKGTYNPFTNEINKSKNKEIDFERYTHLKNIFMIHKEEDKYHLIYTDYVKRIFEGTRELTFEMVEDMFLKLLKDKTVNEIVSIIRKEIERELEPFDIWYNKFLINPMGENLDEKVKQKYPTLDDFQKGIKDILLKLGFDEETSIYLSEKIEVDPARGAGHAWGPEMRGEKAHLRTRAIDAKYMNWQAFNTAMHELGHCVEQIFTLYDVDYNLLSGVPNTAFTEAMAFVFQNQALKVLEDEKITPINIYTIDTRKAIKLEYEENYEHFKNIQTYWDTREIAGVALVDMYVWRWMYKKKNFKVEELREKVLEIASDIWNKYYFPIFKEKDSPILAIYSHMIFHGLYLPDYPLGHIIAHQIEKHFRTNPIGEDMKRICKLGSITPIKWMKEAVGKEISVDELINDTKHSIEKLRSKYISI